MVMVILTMHCVLASMLDVLPTFLYILTTASEEGHYYPYFTEKEAEVWRGELNRPNS